MRNLENASHQSGIPYQLEWEPFLLNPQMSNEGEKIMDHLTKKYGPSAVKRFGSRNSYLNEAGRKVGIHFHPDRYVYPTVMCHALMEYVKTVDNNKANQLMETFYKKYFELGENINDIEVLKGIAKPTLISGLHVNDDASTQTEEAVEKALVDAMKDVSLKQLVVSKDLKAKTQMHIQGVPYFVIERNDGKRAIEFSGAQPADIIAEQLEIAAQEK